MSAFVDTNVLIRHLTGDPVEMRPGDVVPPDRTELLVTDLVVAETVYVLESFYEIPVNKSLWHFDHSSLSPQSRRSTRHYSFALSRCTRSIASTSLRRTSSRVLRVPGSTGLRHLIGPSIASVRWSASNPGANQGATMFDARRILRDGRTSIPNNISHRIARRPGRRLRVNTRSLPIRRSQRQGHLRLGLVICSPRSLSEDKMQLAVDQFTCRIKVTGVGCGLRHDVEHDLAEAVEPPEAEEIGHHAGAA